MAPSRPKKGSKAAKTVNMLARKRTEFQEAATASRQQFREDVEAKAIHKGLRDMFVDCCMRDVKLKKTRAQLRDFAT